MESFSSISCLNFEETELSLSIPGESRLISSSVNSGGGGGGGRKKRGFDETSSSSNNVDLTLGNSSSSCSDGCYSRTSNSTKPPTNKAQVVGWPPVKSTRKNIMSTTKTTMMVKSSSKLVKVAVDGAPYLRKVDLEMYGSYEELLIGLENMFSCLALCNNVVKEMEESANGMEYVPTYEDRDGDWMLVGDVPWKMFVESCKRMRLMKKGNDQEISGATANCSTTSSKV